MVPHETRAACRDTLTGCDLVSICANLGLPGSGPRLFHLSPFRQTGLARGGVRRGATKSSHRDGTGCDLRRCGGALPFPHTVTHFSRISIGISFLLSTRAHPPLKLPRLFESAVSPAPTWAGLGRARSIHPPTLALAHRLGGGFTPSNQPNNQSMLPRHTTQPNSSMHTFLRPPSRTDSTQAVPAGQTRIVFWSSIAFSFGLDVR